MKSFKVKIAITGCFIISVLFALKGVVPKWSIQKDLVKISFKMPHEPCKGTITGLTANIEFDPLLPEKSSIRAKADVKTLQTEDPDQTSSILEKNFFDPEKYPDISFESSKIVKRDSMFIASGRLTIKNTTKDVDIPFFFEDNGRRGVFRGNLMIYSGDFKLLKEKPNDPSTQVDIEIEVPVVKF